MNRRCLLAAILWSLGTTPAWAADWPQLGNTPEHPGYAPESLRPPFRLKWNVQFQPERLYPAVQAVVSGGRAYLGTENGSFFALSAADGAKLWRFPADEKERVGPILHTAGVEGGRIFFASMDGCVYALEAQSGKLAWKFSSGLRTGFSTAVLLAEGRVFAPNRSGMFFALGQSDGQPAWKMDLGCRLLQTPAYHEGRLYVAGMDMVLRGLDSTTGRELWRTPPIDGLALKDYWPVVHKGLVIVRPVGPWEAAAFEETTGKPVEIKIPGGITMNGAVAPPCVDSDGKLVTALGGGWCRVDPQSRAIEEISEKQGRGGHGNNDENMIANACRDVIFVLHCEEGNAQFTGCYEISKKAWTQIHGPKWGNFTSNTQGGGASQGVVADGALFHVSLHGLRCFEGAQP